MRNMKMALAVLALLAMAGTSFAGLEISVALSATQPSNPAYQSWLVKVGGVRSWDSLNIAGTVVQSNKFDQNFELDPAPYFAIPTVWGVGGPSMPTAHKAIDTHMMIATPGIQLGKTGIETNIAYGVDGLTEPPVSVIPSASSYYANLGTFTSEPQAANSLAAAMASGTSFMQVVIPAQSMVWLNMNTDVGVVHQAIGVPEPGTIALLIAGALCLLAVRRR